MNIIAHIYTDFADKFGVPRQSGLVEALEAKIVFEPEYRNPEALRGLETFSHLWLIWCFSKIDRDRWQPTVRPPRLGGNKRMGVFATRSPFRPNPIGLSAVRINKIELNSKEGPVIYVAGADMMNGTPIYDIKPYLPYADIREDAVGGFTDTTQKRKVKVDLSPDLLELIPTNKREALIGVLEYDPRPSYQDDPERIYGFGFGGMEVRFTVDGEVLRVHEIKNYEV